jgi:tripartite-type tricarboxylate transporter receptor subunit TctC
MVPTSIRTRISMTTTRSAVRKAVVASIAAVVPWLPSSASAQDYPAKAVRVIVPYAAGGGADLLARLVGQELSQRLKQSVIVENQGGGANTIGMRTVAASPKDGYTLGLATPVFLMTPSLMKNHPYDPPTDFTPVAMIGFTPLVLVVHPSVAAKTTKEFIALARASPGTLNYASLGAATTQGLAATMFNSMTGIDAVQVPYKGSAPGVTDLLAGNVQFMFNATPSMVPYIQAGKVRALGVSSAKRSMLIPDVPPLRETVPGYEVTTWYSLVAPAGTPKAIVERLNREIRAIVETPEMKEKLRGYGVEPEPMTPEELAAHFRIETAKWAKVIAEAKIKAE